jgi:hypothetical protein
MARQKNTPLSQPVFDEAHTTFDPSFAESDVTPDPSRFNTLHDPKKDKQLYKEIQDLLAKDVVSFDPMRGKPDDLYSLERAYGPVGPKVMAQLKKTGQITFHAAGDTGASTDTRGKYRDELTVADQVADDCHTSPPTTRPCFFYHLGDVVYNFCESEYWYDQFYEPYRNYPGPIFAIPGNHDSFILPGIPAANHPLITFARNFCSPQPAITREAASLHRTAMTQPGVYFTLDAPFVRIIGLFSNALEDPGVISNQSGKWTNVPNYQIAYLKSQLQRIKDENYNGAVLLAVHHPPFTYSPQKQGRSAGGNHGSSIDMLAEIDSICKQVGVYPHAFLSGHAHNYQRFMRNVGFAGNNYEVPFIVCGDGGHNVNPIVHSTRGQIVPEPHFGTDVSYLDVKPEVDSKGLVLKKYADSKTSYGYLRVTVDKSSLAIGFHQVGISSLAQSRFDLVTIDLTTHRATAN